MYKSLGRVSKVCTVHLMGYEFLREVVNTWLVTEVSCVTLSHHWPDFLGVPTTLLFAW